ncbi:MAG: right-handed parallel beta-helix repeat-containing protein [bacterium]
MHRLIALLVALPASAFAEARTAATPQELIAAVSQANPGDTITVTQTFTVDQKISVTRPGPVTVTASAGAIIAFDTVEGFLVQAPDWTFDGLTIRGVCGNDSDCEHAFHIVGGAERTRVRNSRLINFNAQIKGNGDSGSPRNYPDDVVIEYNEFFDEAARQTSNPVTKIDVVGGRRWVVRHNYIHDFAKGQGNGVSYAAFLKGNSRDGLFDSNLVVCEQLHSGQTRLGLSFGGGGSAPDSICEDATCTPEHQNGTMVNNIIANCGDVGIYLNKASGTRLINNTVVGTSGIDVRFDTSTATVINNVVQGRIRERDGGVVSANTTNLTEIDPSAFFVDYAALNFAGVNVQSLVDAGTNEPVERDFCGRLRDGTVDIGALEYSLGEPCDTTTAFHQNAENPGGEDMGMADSGGEVDMGMAGEDTGAVGSDIGIEGADMGAPKPDAGSAVSSGSDDGCASIEGSPGVLILLGVGLFWRRRLKH